MSAQIALVDDDPAVLDALGLFLEAHGFRVLRWASAIELLAGLAAHPALDCIVSDVRMPSLSGLELQERLKALDSPIPLILITGHGDIDMAVRAIKAGAHDFLEKPFKEDRLLNSIQIAISAARTRQTEVLEIAHLRSLRQQLTDREREVMNLAADGYTNKEIGEALGISFRTVEIHRAKVMDKMQAASLADLVRIAIRLGGEADERSRRE